LTMRTPAPAKPKTTNSQSAQRAQAAEQMRVARVAAAAAREAEAAAPPVAPVAPAAAAPEESPPGEDRIPRKKRAASPVDAVDEDSEGVTVIGVVSSPNNKKKKVSVGGGGGGDDDDDDNDDGGGGDDDDDSVDSLACFQNRNTISMKKLNRHIPPNISHPSPNRTFSACFALACAIDDTLFFENNVMNGGHLAAGIRQLMHNPGATNATLLQRANNVITSNLSPIYKYVAVEDPHFNVWLYGTTYPVVALIPIPKHGIQKVHGFAVAHNWIYNCMLSAGIELTPSNLFDLGYFDELPSEPEEEDEEKKLAAAKPSADTDNNKKLAAKKPSAGADDKRMKGKIPQVMEYQDKKYVIAKGVRHFAVMLNTASAGGPAAAHAKADHGRDYGPPLPQYGGGGYNRNRDYNK
jgi:hypothetical protein